MVGTWRALRLGMREMMAAAAGAVVLIVTSALPTEAARRRNNMDDFCNEASDLCVFVCGGGGVGCPTANDGYICESRHGSLAVEIGDETAYYEADYSLCWHKSRRPDDPVPDPEHEPVPRWPGDGERAMCIQCKRQEKICYAFVKHGEAICRNFYNRKYTDHCASAFKAGKRPSDRRGRPYKPKDTYCANVLDTEDALNSEYEDFDTDPHTRKRLLQARKKCESKLIEECVDHFAQDLPDEENNHRFGVELHVKDFFGGLYEGSRTIHWGGNKGYMAGCNDAADVAGSVCIHKRQECDRKANPDKPCPL